MPVTSDDFYLVDSGTGFVMVPRKKLQAVLDREFPEGKRTTDSRLHRNVRFRDAAPMSNLRGPAGRSDGSWDRLPAGRGRDAGAEGSQGTTGTAFGGTPRRAPQPDKFPGSKGFTVDQVQHYTGTGLQFKNPSLDQEPPEDDEEDTEGLGEKVGMIPPPDPGCVYVIEQVPGGVTIRQELDTGADMSTHDRTYRHSLRDRDPLLRRMNRVNSNRFRDADMVRKTIYHHVLGPNERLALEENEKTGGYDLVIYAPATTNMLGPVPPATGSAQRDDNPGTKWPAEAWVAQSSQNPMPGEHSIHQIQSPVRTGDRRTEPMMLREMNRAAARFWAR